MRILKAAADFKHAVGKEGWSGWELNYKRDRPGYALSGLIEPLYLEPGVYRFAFVVRRGKYPKKGLLHDTYKVFRIEAWDLTANELINQRDIQISDLSRPNSFEERWLEFSMTKRDGHAIEPRVYWIGLTNAEIEEVHISQFSTASFTELESKAHLLGELLDQRFLENGFVVSRRPDGTADETGDALTYTGFYTASLAWKYAVTKDPMTADRLETAVWTLHSALKGTPEYPLLTRFVDDEGQPFEVRSSKDVYTSFFFAYSAAYPYIQNERLKKQMRLDAQNIGTRFLKDGLTVRGPHQILVSLTPYLTEDEIRSGVRELLADKKLLKKTVKGMKNVKRYLPFSEPWPRAGELMKAMEQQDENKIMRLVIPTMNGILDLTRRVRDLLREQYRDDLFPRRFRNQDYPGRKLANVLTEALKKMGAGNGKESARIQRLSDVNILGSNALISLHMIQTAHRLTQSQQFEEYYHLNLYTQDSLLQTALDWYGFEEEIIPLTAGNPTANNQRRGYLSALSMYNLIQHEENPAVKENYQSILARSWPSNQNEDNPLEHAIQYACSDGKRGDVGLILRGLSLYPSTTTGFGPAFWDKHGEEIGENLGAGVYRNHSREPLPIFQRPKDSFLWQRNARRLRGDYVRDYPGTDYLFVYWLCRYHNIIPATPAQPVAKQAQ